MKDKIANALAYIIVTVGVIGAVLLAALLFAFMPRREPGQREPGQPIVCPARIEGAQVALITRRTDSVLCLYDGGVLASEDIRPRGR